MMIYHSQTRHHVITIFLKILCVYKTSDFSSVFQRPDGTNIRPSMTDNKDGTFTVTYTPEDLGPYCINIFFDGKPVPGVPFRTVAKPTGDAQKCKITGKKNRGKKIKI